MFSKVDPIFGILAGD